MVGLSELTGEKEIIFPEVAALSVGTFLHAKLAWKTSYAKMIFCITICAALGLFIVIFLDIPIWLQFSLAFALGQMIFFFSKTSFAPMISAISLLNGFFLFASSFSPVYFFAAILLTVLIVFLSISLEKFKIKEKNEYEKFFIEKKEFFSVFLFRTVLVMLFAYFCIRFDVRFCVAPPLLVAFTELTSKNSKVIKRFFSVILIVSLCAFTGAFSRYLISIYFSLPLTFSAFFASVFVLLFIKIFSLPFPPAAAMSALAMLISEKDILMYSLEVFIGITLLSILALIWRRLSNILLA